MLFRSTATDEYIGVGGTGAITITLPAGVVGKTYIIKNERSGTTAITISATNPDTIDGNASTSLAKNASLSVVYNNSQWRII